MGCDIHATLEYDTNARWRKESSQSKIQKVPYWVSFAKDIEIHRDYHLFGILAGVRGYETPIAPPRGKPDRPTDEFLYELEDYGEDGHSASWVTFDELDNWRTDLPIDGDNPYDFKDETFYTVMHLLGEKYGKENVRLSFFFDN